MRAKPKSLAASDKVAENVPFTFPLKDGGEEIRLAPFVYTTALWERIKLITK